MITQVPEDANVTTPEDSEHTVPSPDVIENDGVKPEDAVAAGVYVVPDTADTGTVEVKLIDWFAFAIVMVCVAAVDALKLASASRVALTEHDPAPVGVITAPEREQSPVAEYVIEPDPEPPVATKVTGCPNVAELDEVNDSDV